MLKAFLAALACATLAGALPAAAQEVTTIAGWQVMYPTQGTHKATVDVGAPRGGKGCAKIAGQTGEGNARACLIQEFVGKNALKTGGTYRYSVSYRTETPLDGRGLVLIDCYPPEGEKGRKELLSKRIDATPEWTTVSGEVSVPEGIARVRLLLYLYGKGTIWYDDAFFGETGEHSPNLLRNGPLEPPACYVYDLAPEKPGGPVRLSADFENGTLGKAKQLGPDEFYLYAFPEGKPHSPFLWFHFQVEGCQDREITFHINPTPFAADKTGGNGTRLPVMSYDGDHWTGIEPKSWNEDGTALTFKQRFTKSPAWVASFFPFTGEHVTRFIAEQRGNAGFRAGVLGKSAQGHSLRFYTIPDPAVPEAEKRTVLFTTLQHDLETTGALALEGISRYLLSEEPGAAALRRAFVFHVVPMMNPDGIAGGNLYCPVGNMNRQWGLGTTPEATAVERFARDLAARGRKIDLFMDFHGWCTPERTTLFMTFGKEICDAATETDAVRLAEMIKRRLKGKVHNTIWRKMVSYVTMGDTDVRRMIPGWMKFEAGARLAYSIEIFGEGECTQEEYLAWGRAFAEGMAEFYR